MALLVAPVNIVFLVFQLSITADGVYTERGSTAGSFSFLASSALYVGGTDAILPGPKRNNFVGCLRKAGFISSSSHRHSGELSLTSLRLSKGRVTDVPCYAESQVELVADSLQLDLIDLARSGNRLVQAKGNIHFLCQEVDAADPVTFTTRDSFLVQFSPRRKSTSGLVCFVSSKMHANELAITILLTLGFRAVL